MLISSYSLDIPRRSPTISCDGDQTETVSDNEVVLSRLPDDFMESDNESAVDVIIDGIHNADFKLRRKLKHTGDKLQRVTHISHLF